MSPWISVKDKLPDHYKDVLICCAEMLPIAYFVGHYQPNHKSWYKPAFSPPEKYITHWRELDKPLTT